MLGNIQTQTEDQLLTLLLMILSRPTVLTARDATEIDQIEAEFLRRSRLDREYVTKRLLDECDPFVFATPCHMRDALRTLYLLH
jgi:hypothetical protein